MMKTYLLSGTIAMMCAGALAAAQAPAEQPNQTRPEQTTQSPPTTTAQPSTPRPATGQQAAMTTLTGCLYRESEIPGRQPNVAERAGILEDYILVVSAPAGGAAQPGATTGATGTSGAAGSAPAAKMYKVELIPDEQLRAHVGKRVEIAGKIDAGSARGTSGAAAPAPDRGLGPDQIELPEFEATSIKEVTGNCAPTPSVR